MELNWEKSSNYETGQNEMVKEDVQNTGNKKKNVKIRKLIWRIQIKKKNNDQRNYKTLPRNIKTIWEIQ